MGRPSGGIPWNKGIKTGIIPRSAFKKGFTPANKGKKLSEQARKNMSRAHQGFIMSAEQKIKIGLASKGRRWTLKQRENYRKSKINKPIIKLQGKNHWNWQGGKNSENLKIRHSVEYKLWRTAVFERDNFTCIWCGEHGGKLNADHIKSFARFPELRFAIDNGRTLCVPCHKSTHSYLNRWHKE